ncbi:unnamed protein product [Parascedosporium putredinis]|uniref:FAR1 domain-containing protein n=1 Tax=Parascedosporium putredinis TaxID=1442378 RepID=A0A9P1MAE0_9PEZI|nr:unnamed protein product [Parascedosporium putredinis]CAI7997489.1 unnamed protein product [Parascedosporium putredinis]
MFGMLTPAPQAPGPTYVYKTYEDLFADLSLRMQSDGYKVVKARSHRGKIGGADVPGNEMVRCDLVCDRGGRPYKCLATKHKTSTKKTDCPWKAKAVNRKMMGGWVLTVICDQHNHEPGTPEPPSPAVSEHDADEELDENEGPVLDAETSAAIAVAGVSQARVQILAQLQMRIAAIYAIENEDTQRQVRLDQQERRHRQIDTRRHFSTAGSGSGTGGLAGERRSRRATAAALDGGDGDDRTVQGSPSATRRTQATLQDDQGMQQPHLDLQGQMTGSRIMSQQHQQQQQHTQDDVDSFIHGERQIEITVQDALHAWETQEQPNIAQLA